MAWEDRDESVDKAFMDALYGQYLNAIAPDTSILQAGGRGPVGMPTGMTVGGGYSLSHPMYGGSKQYGFENFFQETPGGANQPPQFYWWEPPEYSGMTSFHGMPMTGAKTRYENQVDDWRKVAADRAQQGYLNWLDQENARLGRETAANVANLKATGQYDWGTYGTNQEKAQYGLSPGGVQMTGITRGSMLDAYPNPAREASVNQQLVDYYASPYGYNW